jgi:hypothetical protein
VPALACSAALVLALAACGGGSSTTSPSPASGATAAPTLLAMLLPASTGCLIIDRAW